MVKIKKHPDSKKAPISNKRPLQIKGAAQGAKSNEYGTYIQQLVRLEKTLLFNRITTRASRIQLKTVIIGP